MGNIYIVIMLIGILCVLLTVVVILTVKIRLDMGRWENARKRESYEKKIQSCKRIRKILVCILGIDVVFGAGYFALSIVGKNDSTVAVDSGLIEKMKVVYNDPKDRLVQNEEEKIKDIFMDGLYFSWAGEEKTKEDYKNNVDKLLAGGEPVSDALVKKPKGKEKDAFDSYVSRQKEIDQAKVPEGATLEDVQQGKVPPKELTADEYKEEFDLWKMIYLLYPIAANLQQMARAAVDVQTTMMKYEEYKDDWNEIIEYAMQGVQAYLALMFYESSEESKADCCYWIAKIFCDLAQKMPAQYKQYVRHCYLMAYTFAEKGLSYEGVDQRTDDHIFDMKKIRDKADEALGYY